MMTTEMITAMLDTAAADSWYSVSEDGTEIAFTLNDFEGFDSHWNEIEREYENPAAVETLLDWLEENADSVEGDFYTTFYFGEISVELSYTSMDIWKEGESLLFFAAKDC